MIEDKTNQNNDNNNKKKKSKTNIKTKTFKKKNPNALKIHVTPLIMEDGLIIKSRTTTTKKSVR